MKYGCYKATINLLIWKYVLQFH